MTLTHKEEERYRLLCAVNGSILDEVAATLLKQQLIILNAEGIKNIVLDLLPCNEAIHLDVIGALIIGGNLCKSIGGILVVLTDNITIIETIELTQANTTVCIMPTIEEAIDAIFFHDLEQELGAEDFED